jgi:Na+/H+ antiporter NhaC
MPIKDTLKDMLTDERGSTSHKRVIVTLGAICLFVGLFLNTHINEHVAELIAGIVAVGMGFTTWDKFSVKKKDNE